MARQIVQRAKSHKLEQPMFPSALKKHTVTLLHLFIYLFQQFVSSGLFKFERFMHYQDSFPLQFNDTDHHSMGLLHS